MDYSQKRTIEAYLSKAIWSVLFAVNCCILLYMICHICKIWTSQNFDIIKTYLIFDQEAEFKNLVFAKRQLWIALGVETFLLVLGGYFTYDFLVRVKNLRSNVIGTFILLFCIFTGESLLLFFPAPDKAIEIQTCESIPIRNCSGKSKNCTPRYITWNKENHYCNLIELERQRMIKFLEQKAVEKKQALIDQQNYARERAKYLEKKALEEEAKAAKEAEKQSANSAVSPTPVFPDKVEKTEPVSENPAEQKVEEKIDSVPVVPDEKPVEIQKKNEEVAVPQPKVVKKKYRKKKSVSVVKKEQPANDGSTEPLKAPISLLKK